MESDVELLTRYGFMDYSVYLIVVIKPFKKVEFVKQAIHGLSVFHDIREDSHSSHHGGSKKKMYIGETNPALLKRKDADDIVLLKEKSNLRSKVYHICDSYDIFSVK